MIITNPTGMNKIESLLVAGILVAMVLLSFGIRATLTRSSKTMPPVVQYDIGSNNYHDSPVLLTLDTEDFRVTWDGFTLTHLSEAQWQAVTNAYRTNHVRHFYVRGPVPNSLWTNSPGSNLFRVYNPAGEVVFSVDTNFNVFRATTNKAQEVK